MHEKLDLRERDDAGGLSAEDDAIGDEKTLTGTQSSIECMCGWLADLQSNSDGHSQDRRAAGVLSRIAARSSASDRSQCFGNARIHASARVCR